MKKTSVITRSLASMLAIIPLLFAILFGVASSAPAATSTWTGATATWNTPGNWSALPADGDSLIFGAAGAGGTALNNDLTSSAFTINGITFNAGAPAYVISNNPFILGAGGVVNNSVSHGTQTINNAITLGAPCTINVPSGSAIFAGAIANGGNQLTIDGIYN